jgi:hypothetical protein
MQKEVPILFSTAMVQALLGGRRTQTRRVVKDNIPVGNLDETAKRCPYGKPGDLLYVRETHYRFGHWEPIPGKTRKNGKPKYQFVEDTDEVLFEAPRIFRKGMHNADPAYTGWYKRNSLFMLKDAARIWLEVTDVRVERLQDISEEDAVQEGIDIVRPEPFVHRYRDYLATPNTYYYLASDSFKSLWDKINGRESWDANPWVWVVSFKVVSTTGRSEIKKP